MSSDAPAINLVPAPRHLARLLLDHEAGVIAALLTAVVVFYLLEPSFLAQRNVYAMLNICSFVGIIAIGQTVLLINGEFDLSVGSVAGLGAVVSAKLMTAGGLAVPLALLGGIAVGAVAGLVNGLVVVRCRIPAFIQTLGMLFIGQGLIQVITGGYPVYPLPPVIAEIGRTQLVGGLGWSFLFFLVAALAGDFALRRTVVGRNMYATGGNAIVAQLVGISTARYKVGAFVFAGAISAVAGLFVMADLGSGTTAIGSGWELNVIAGVVVGGVSLFGGTGTILGGLLGVLLLQAVQSGLVIVGVSANWQQIAVGGIMILAVGIDTLRRRLALTASPDSETTSSARRVRPGLLLVGGVAVGLALGIFAWVRRDATASATPQQLLWVLPMRDHPVFKIMEAGFLDRCAELGVSGTVVGNASATRLDVAASIPLAEAARARTHFGSVGVLALDTSILPYIAKLAEEGYPVVTWHMLPPPGTIPGLAAATGHDVKQVGRDAAHALGRKLGGRGVVAVTQGSFNEEENAKAAAFRRSMGELFPAIRVLEPELEGFEPMAAKGKAISILQANPDVVGVFSTTGNGAETWSGAARTAERKVVIIAMDYVRRNLDLVRSGEVYGLVAQPLYEEGARAAELGAALARGETVPYLNPLPAPVITADDLEPYYQLLARARQ